MSVSLKGGGVHFWGAPTPKLCPPPKKRYLEEVGYSDTILDMRSRRVRALLGRGGPPKSAPPPPPPPPPASLLLRRIEEQIQR